MLCPAVPDQLRLNLPVGKPNQRPDRIRQPRIAVCGVRAVRRRLPAHDVAAVPFDLSEAARHDATPKSSTS
jgi:hypothetical protein